MSLDQLKRAGKKIIAYGKNQMGNGSCRLTKKEFCEMLGQVWKESMKPTNIISGFKSCGIFPVDATMFPKTEFNVVNLEAYEVLMQRNHPSEASILSPTVPETPHLEDTVSENQVRPNH